MKLGVERDRRAVRSALHGARAAIANEQHVRVTGELPRLRGPDVLAELILHVDDRPCSDVEPGLDRATIAERYSRAGVRAYQAAFADADAHATATRQRALRAGAAAQVAVRADDDTLRNPTLYHVRAECAGVEVHEPFVHHGRPFAEICTQPDARCVRDTNAGRDHVVGHAGKLVDAVHRQRPSFAP